MFCICPCFIACTLPTTRSRLVCEPKERPSSQRLGATETTLDAQGWWGKPKIQESLPDPILTMFLAAVSMLCWPPSRNGISRINRLLVCSILLAAFAVLPAPFLAFFVGLALLVLPGSHSGTPDEVVLVPPGPSNPLSSGLIHLSFGHVGSVWVWQLLGYRACLPELATVEVMTVSDVEATVSREGSEKPHDRGDKMEAFIDDPGDAESLM
ncbi:hypothetical protein QBC47DRAFT_386539, partial [Echria macrotheca]